MALRIPASPVDEEAGPPARDTERLRWLLLSAVDRSGVALVTFTMFLLDGGQTTRSGLAFARLVRHALLFLAVAKVPLAVAMVLSALGGPLMLAIGFAMALGARLPAAVLAAVALPTEAGPADSEYRPAQAALSRKERDAPALRHRPRNPGLDSDR